METRGRAHQESARVGLAAADRLIVRVRQVLVEEALGFEETTGSDGGGGGGGGRHLMLHQMAQLSLNSRSGDRKEKVHGWSELQCQWAHHYSTVRDVFKARHHGRKQRQQLNGKKTLDQLLNDELASGTLPWGAEYTGMLNVGSDPLTAVRRPAATV
jgi:hypothetical protein